MPGPRHILVPIHRSRSSRAALSVARSMAAATGAELRLLSVRPLRARSAEGLAFAANLDEGVEALGLASITNVESRVIDGDPLQVILDEAARADVDLVVIGHGERGWVARGLRRPLHERVVRWCRAPVLVVPVSGFGDVGRTGHESAGRGGQPPVLTVLRGQGG